MIDKLPEGHHCKAWGDCNFCQECGQDITPSAEKQMVPPTDTAEGANQMNYDELVRSLRVSASREDHLKAATAIEELQAKVKSLEKELAGYRVGMGVKP
jgi:hypothetical protein